MVTAHVGQDAVLPCEVEGDSSPTIMWRKDGFPINKDNKKYVIIFLVLFQQIELLFLLVTATHFVVYISINSLVYDTSEFMVHNKGPWSLTTINSACYFF